MNTDEGLEPNNGIFFPNRGWYRYTYHASDEMTDTIQGPYKDYVAASRPMRYIQTPFTTFSVKYHWRKPQNALPPTD